MRTIIIGLAAALSLGACQSLPPATTSTGYAAAISDAGRPATDTARDVNRKPAEMLAFADIKSGEKIGELLPGGGYFTRIFSKAVGSSGHVYAIVPQQVAGEGAAPAGKPPAVAAIAADPAYANVTLLQQDFSAIAPPEKLDLVWTSQNYHDLHLTRAKADVAAINKAIFAALKPGGIYIVLDHAAAPGTGLDVPDKLHRINPDIVKAEVTAAGFKYVGEDKALRNPADDHSKLVFDPAIRGKTDQFIYKFRKPN